MSKISESLWQLNHPHIYCVFSITLWPYRIFGGFAQIHFFSLCFKIPFTQYISTFYQLNFCSFSLTIWWKFFLKFLFSILCIIQSSFSVLRWHPYLDQDQYLYMSSIALNWLIFNILFLLHFYSFWWNPFLCAVSSFCLL